MHPNDPLYSQQWHLTRLGNIERVWDEYSGAGVHVGIYDNGVQSAHPDLASNYDPSLRVTIAGVLQDGEVNPVAQTDARARGHGTAVAGLIGAAANNGEGGVGVAWGAGLTSVNIYESLLANPGNGDDLIEAIEQMVNFDVTNNSWNRDDPFYLPSDNQSDPTSYVSREINAYALVSETGRSGLGTVIVQGIGNDNLEVQGNGLNATRYTISVAGYGPDGFASEYSNYGAAILVTAPTRSSLNTPGPGLVTTDLTGTDGYNLEGGSDPSSYTLLFGGTSGSGPIVTGVAALMLQANPNLGWRDVQNILAASATHTGSAIGAVTPGTNENSNWYFNDAANWNGGGMHFSNDYGYGVVNAYNAVRMAETWSLFQHVQVTSNEHNWSNWKWGGGNASTGIPIADLATAQDSISLVTDPYAISIEHVDVTIDFVHQDFTDLRISLVSPEGTEVQLYDGTGGTDATADSELKWTFGVDALRGEHASGTWQLRIDDVDGGNAGQFYWFEVKVFGQGTSGDPSARNDTYHYTDEFLAMKALAGEVGRGTLSDAGGIDWIDAAAVTGNFALKLDAGLASTVNGVTWFTIAAGTLIENAVTGDGNDTLTGNGAANTLLGIRGSDTLDGGAGNDTLKGGKGNDTYIIGSSGDVADETGGTGTDLVRSAITFSLSDTVHAKGVIENLTLLAGAVNATGNAFANLLTGNTAANLLNGLGGGDTMTGLAGNDSYVVDNWLDKVSEAGGTGTDTVSASFSFSLANTARVFGIVENLVLANVAAALTGTGNGFNNVITGNNFNNALNGGIGNDKLNGGLGNDKLSGDIGADVLAGSTGSDTLTGGAGIDTLTGGTGNDFFVFNAPLSAANRDTITDFANVSGNNDAIRLENAVMTKLGAGVHALNAAFFRAGASALDANDHVIYNRANGNLSYDSNGNLGGGVTLLAVLTTRPVLTAADFFVI